MSSTVASFGRLIVLDAPPERNGWTAPSILRWPIGGIVRFPPIGASAQSKTVRSSASRPGAPSIVPVRSTWAAISADLVRRVSEGREAVGDGPVDHPHDAAADEVLGLDEGELRLEAERVAAHQEPDRPRGGDHRDLGVAVAPQLAGLHRVVPAVDRGREDGRQARVVDRRPAPPHGRAWTSRAASGRGSSRSPAKGPIRFAISLDMWYPSAERIAETRRGQRPAGVRVVGEAVVHEERTQVRVARGRAAGSRGSSGRSGRWGSSTHRRGSPSRGSSCGPTGGTVRRRTAPFGSRNFIRLIDERLHAVSSRNRYSLHGFDALIRPEFGLVCQSFVMVVELHAGVAAPPGGVGELPPELAGTERPGDRMVGPVRASSTRRRARPPP